MIYFTMFSFLVVLAWSEAFLKIKNKTKTFMVVLISTFWFLLSSFRWERGTDWNPYYSFFMGDPLNSNRGWEAGYVLLNHFIKLIFGNRYTVLIIALALFVFIFQSKYIIDIAKKTVSIGNTKNNVRTKKVYTPIIIMLGLYSIFLGNIFPVRSTIAYVILFYSIRLIKEKNPLKFLILVAIASSFHRSAIVFALGYWVYHIKATKKIVSLSILLIPAISYLFSPLAIKIASFLGSDYSYRIQAYLIDASTSGSWISFLNMTILLIIFVYSYLRIFRFDPDFKGMLNLFYFGFLLYFAAFINSPVLYRIATPFIVTQIPLISYFINIFNRRDIKTLVFIIVILYFSFRFYSTINGYWDLYIPYKSIFNKDLDVIIY